MKSVVWGLVVLLVILHQDIWFWNDTTLLFGFLPITLGYHACISIGAAITWYLATIFCWPEEVVPEVSQSPADSSASAGGQGE